MSAGWHVAQVNIALPREPLDSPALADFVANLEPVNALADVARGFVTPPGSLEDYGVVLDPVTLSVDKNATDEARARRAGPLTLIDRGEGFAKAEASWHASVIARAP